MSEGFKVGDEVIYQHGHRGVRIIKKVEAVSPTGIVRVEGSRMTFRRDGSARGSDFGWGGRPTIERATKEAKAEIRTAHKREQLMRSIRNVFDYEDSREKISTENLQTIAELCGAKSE